MNVNIYRSKSMPVTNASVPDVDLTTWCTWLNMEKENLHFTQQQCIHQPYCASSARSYDAKFRLALHHLLIGPKMKHSRVLP